MSLKANPYAGGVSKCVYVCVCVRAEMGLAGSAVVLKGKITAFNSPVSHQPLLHLYNGGGLGSHSRPPTKTRNTTNTEPLKQVLY